MKNIFRRRGGGEEPEQRYKYMVKSGSEIIAMDEMPTQIRSSIEREFRALQRGASGVSDSGLTQAFKLSITAYACISYFATTAASIPVVVKDKHGIAEYHPFIYFMSQYRHIIELSVRSQLIWGKIYLRKLYNKRDTLGAPAGFPTGLEFINPNNIRQKINRETGLIESYEVRYAGTSEKFNLLPEEVIYISDFDPAGDGNPLSSLESAFTALSIDLGLGTYVTTLFFNGAALDGIVRVPANISDTAFEKFKREWKRNFSGAKNAHKIAFIKGEGIEWVSVSTPPKDLAMSELSDDTKQKICAAIRVPQKLVGLGDTSSSSLSPEEVTARERAFLSNIVIPFVDNILGEMTGQWIAPDFVPNGLYSICTNAKAMPIFSSLTAEMVASTIQLVQSGSITYEQQLEMLGITTNKDKDDLQLARIYTPAMELYNNGVISLNMANKLLGLPEVFRDRWMIDGKTVLSSDVDDVLQSHTQYEEVQVDNDSIISQSDLVEIPNDVDVGNNIEDKITEPPKMLSAPSRAAYKISFAVNFANHSFVKIAQRTLAKSVTSNDVRWIDSDDWQTPILDFDSCSEDDIINIMSKMNFMSGDQIELRMSGYSVVDNAIYCELGQVNALSDFRNNLMLNIEDVSNIAGDPLTFSGIKLCECDGIDQSAIDDIELHEYILVVDNLSMSINGRHHHTWKLNHVTDKQRSELSAWRSVYRKAEKRNAKYSDVNFDVLELPQHVVDYINDEMSKDSCDIDLVFKEARDRLSKRAIQSTLIDFELFIADIIASARSGELKRARFTNILRNGINRYSNAAYRDGLIDGGVLDGILSEEDKEIADGLIKENQSFAKNLSARIYSKDGISDEEAATRPAMWSKRVVRNVYDAGRLSADRNGMYEFTQISPTFDKCNDCIRLTGQVHRLKDWKERNLLVPNPGRQATECEGWNCGHGLVKTSARANGRF